MVSHVNDTGFELFKECFNHIAQDKVHLWSVTEAIVGLMYLDSVLLLLN
jgi:H+/gluconate symporter-like permease